eukprot:556967_1
MLPLLTANLRLIARDLGYLATLGPYQCVLVQFLWSLDSAMTAKETFDIETLLSIVFVCATRHIYIGSKHRQRVAMHRVFLCATRHIYIGLKQTSCSYALHICAFQSLLTLQEATIKQGWIWK